MDFRRTSLLSAATIATLGASFATLASNADAASLTVPTSAELTSALTLLNATYGPSTASYVVRFEASPRTSYLGTIDLLIDASVGSTVITPPNSNAPTAPALEATLTALNSLLPASPTAAQRQALAQAQSALLGGGLSVLLNGVTGGSSQNAINQLSALQQLKVGASTATGGAVNAIGAVAGTLSGEAGSGTDATTLTAVSGTLDSTSALTPAQLESAIAGLASVTSTAASGTSGVTVAQLSTALADELAQAGSLMGELGTLGTTPFSATDPADITTALNQLSALTGLAPGANAAVPELTTVLNAIAATPGVSAGAITTLQSVATTLSSGGGLSPTTLSAAAASLTGVASSLPAPLSSLVTQLGGELASSGSVFGTITGLSSANASTALSELTALAGLSGQSQTPALPGIAAVLSQASADVPSADTMQAAALSDLVDAFSSDSMSASDLTGAAQALTYIAQTLPWPEELTISGLASILSSDAASMAGAQSTASSSSSTASSGSTSSSLSLVASAAAPAPATGTGTESSRSGASAAKQVTLVQQAVRNGNSVRVTLNCTAAKGKRCADAVHVSEAGFTSQATRLRIKGGTSKQVTLRLTPKPGTLLAARRSAKRAAIKLTVISGATKVSKILR